MVRFVHWRSGPRPPATSGRIGLALASTRRRAGQRVRSTVPVARRNGGRRAPVVGAAAGPGALVVRCQRRDRCSRRPEMHGMPGEKRLQGTGSASISGLLDHGPTGRMEHRPGRPEHRPGYPEHRPGRPEPDPRGAGRRSGWRVAPTRSSRARTRSSEHDTVIPSKETANPHATRVPSRRRQRAVVPRPLCKGVAGPRCGPVASTHASPDVTQDSPEAPRRRESPVATVRADGGHRAPRSGTVTAAPRAAPHACAGTRAGRCSVISVRRACRRPK